MRVLCGWVFYIKSHMLEDWQQPGDDSTTNTAFTVPSETLTTIH